MTIKFAFSIPIAALAVLFWLTLTLPGASKADTGAPVQPTPATGPNAANPHYVGRQVCGRCHAEQQKQWIGSHHDLAMQPANEQTVLGDFKDTQFTYYGLTSTFSRRDGKFMVRTDGPDGELHDYAIKYTFGVYPLQQYSLPNSDPYIANDNFIVLKQ